MAWKGSGVRVPSAPRNTPGPPGNRRRGPREADSLREWSSASSELSRSPTATARSRFRDAAPHPARPADRRRRRDRAPRPAGRRPLGRGDPRRGRQRAAVARCPSCAARSPTRATSSSPTPSATGSTIDADARRRPVLRAGPGRRAGRARGRRRRDRGRACSPAALALWRGPALDGLADDGALRREALRLEELRVDRARGPVRRRPRAAAVTPRSSPSSQQLTRRAPGARALPRPADAGAVPVGPPGRGAARVPGRARDARRRARPRPGRGAPGSSRPRSSPRTRRCSPVRATRRRRRRRRTAPRRDR